MFFDNTRESDETIVTSLTGRALLNNPAINKGSSFSADERREFGLLGLLPDHISTMEEQLQRTYSSFKSKPNDIEKYIFLSSLHDRNQTLFYRLVQDHMSEMTPIIYTPTVGEACQTFSRIFRRANGLYVSYQDRDQLDRVLKNVLSDDIRVIVVTDGERILGLGDLGVGGMGIPIGKLQLYTLGAGVNPHHTLPVLLDVGTNNQNLLNDPLYLGWRHARLERAEYDTFLDHFIEAVKKRWPHVLVQWEDFAKVNSARLLTRYQNHICSFNDDIQGTAAVTVAALLRATRILNQPLSQQRILIVGAGSASTGIAELVRLAVIEEGQPVEKALDNVWLMDSRGLVHDGRTDLSSEKKPLAKSAALLSQHRITATSHSLLEVTSQLQPTVIIGVSGQPNTFSEAVIREMARHTARPIVLPLSNPTSKSEGTPSNILEWTHGQALVATGSPFPPVIWNGQSIPIGQCNNAFVFPGLGLGLTAVGATRVPNELFLIAAKILANFNKRLPGQEAALIPSLELVQDVSKLIAITVGTEVVKRGLASLTQNVNDVPQLIEKSIWKPFYRKLKKPQRAHHHDTPCMDPVLAKCSCKAKAADKTCG